jgi:ABC-type transporter Mla MlaB component
MRPSGRVVNESRRQETDAKTTHMVAISSTLETQADLYTISPWITIQ